LTSMKMTNFLSFCQSFIFQPLIETWQVQESRARFS
jgi:hypothetical protein